MNSKKTIGLLSLQWMNNYGTIIQTYALQKAIEGKGHYVEYISYLPNKNKTKTNPLISLIKGFPNSLKKLMPYFNNRIVEFRMKSIEAETKEKHRRFEDFRERYIIIGKNKYYSSEQLISTPPEYDIFITGSDQIWSPNVSYANEIYLLNFVNDAKRKNAYASSLGTTNLTSAYKKRLIENLINFNSLSCREKSGAKLLTELLDRNVTEVVDPTMLLKEEELTEIAEKRREIPDKYILCYFLGHKRWHRDFAQELANEQGLPIYYVGHDSYELNKRNSLWDVGPGEFVYLIMNASYICTDSFHGSVLSILFHKSLFGFCKRDDSEETSDNSRMKDLYKKFRIEHRLIGDKNVSTYNREEIDYEVVDKILEKERELSWNYLNSILEGK